MTPEKRPQDPSMDGTGLTFETLDRFLAANQTWREMRVLIVMPHFFRGTVEGGTNRSTQVGADAERLRTLVASV